jgi:hypothetical protein
MSSIDKDDNTNYESTLASTLTLSVAGERGTPPTISAGSKQVGAASAAARACADQALAFASNAAQDAANIDSTHNLLHVNHCKIFLMKVFGINPDGTSIEDQPLLPDRSVQYRSVESIEQYKKMVHILSNWGDDTVLANAPEDDPDANRT